MIESQEMAKEMRKDSVSMKTVSRPPAIAQILIFQRLLS